MGCFCHGHGRQREVNVVFNFHLVCALALGQSGELFGITVKELDLKTAAVLLQNTQRLGMKVGGKKQFSAQKGAIWT